MEVKLINYMHDPVDTMAIAAAQCYNSKPKSSVVQSCIKRGHGSITEHSMYVFEVKGVSRAFLAQITRHRHLQFSVRSQRYVEENNFNYILPDTIKDNLDASKLYTQTVSEIKNCYNKLISLGIPREDARFILPNATEVTMIVSGNYRAWMEFCKLREDKTSQWEIRKFALKVDRLIHEVTPLTSFVELYEHME